MISRAKQIQIFTLAAEGKLNNPQIAKRVGCAKETVRLALRRGTIQVTVRAGKTNWWPAPSPYLTVDDYRCGGCGHVVTLLPCLICECRGK